MKKYILYFLILLILMSFAGCAIKKSYQFLQERSNIHAIEIVKTGENDSQGEIDRETVCFSENTDAFIDDFLKLDCFCIYTDPRGISETL